MPLISLSQKHEILKGMRELEMHKKLKVLFEKIFPKKEVYIGQGTGELGKDLVIIERDPLSGEKVTALVVKMGDLSGKYVCDKELVKCAIEHKLEIYLYEVLGKHSEIWVTLGDDNIRIVSDDEQAVELFEFLSCIGILYVGLTTVLLFWIYKFIHRIKEMKQ